MSANCSVSVKKKLEGGSILKIITVQIFFFYPESFMSDKNNTKTISFTPNVKEQPKLKYILHIDVL
jgi:hypothetical protein